MLGEIAGFQMRRPGHGSDFRLQPAGQQFGERGFAVSVGAEQGDAVVMVDAQVEPAQYRFAGSVTDGRLLQRNDR